MHFVLLLIIIIIIIIIINIICVCILPLVTQHWIRIFSAPYFIVIFVLSGCIIFLPHCLINDRFLRKIYWTQNMCSDFLYNICLICFSFWKNPVRYRRKSMCLHIKDQQFFFRFLRNLNFLDRFFKNPQIRNFVKIRPVGADEFPTWQRDGLTHTTKQLVVLRNVANLPNKSWFFHRHTSPGASLFETWLLKFLSARRRIP